MNLVDLRFDTASPAAISIIEKYLLEIDCDLLVERTRSGLARAKAQGKTLGRPVKTTNIQRATIIDLKAKGASVSALSRADNVSRASILRIVNC